MTWTGDVQITVNDGSGGVVQVPSSTVMAVVGCSSAGTVGTVVSTRSLSTVTSTWGSGPLVEAAGQIIQAGGTVIGVKATSATAGTIDAVAAATISTASNANPSVITTSSPHGFASGMVVVISGVVTNTAVNATWVITVTGPTTFTVPVQGNGAGTGGTATPNGAVFTGTGTSLTTWTGTPNMDCYPVVKVLTGGTIASAGIVVAVSLDAGRNYGPGIPLGTANSLALKDSGGIDTGGTINFAAGTLAKGDIVTGHFIAPATNAADVSAALGALQTYFGAAGISAAPIILIASVMAGSDATSLESGATNNLDSLATNYYFERAIIYCRDAKAPATYGGAGETETAWLAAITTDFAGVTARRVSCAAGWYNTLTAFPTLFAGAPSYRLPLAYAYAGRQVAIPAQRHAGRVKDGPLKSIVVNAATDPTDGFVYHNEFLNPALDYKFPGGAARFTSARTHVGQPGYFITNPLTLAPVGSDFTFLSQGCVMDVACTIARQTMINFANADLVTNANGTLTDKDAGDIALQTKNAVYNYMQAVNMISDFTFQVDQTANVQTTQKISATLTILGVAYALEVDVTAAFTNALASTGS